MAKTFVIIDDVEQDHLYLIEAIDKRKDDADSVLPISVETAGGERTQLAAHPRYKVAKTGEQLFDALACVQGDMIILLDVNLGVGVQEFSHFDDPEFAEKYASFVKDSTRRTVILIHSKDHRSDRVSDRLRNQCVHEDQKERIDYDKYGGLDSASEVVRQTADSIVQDAIALYEQNGLRRLWQQSMQDPVWFMHKSDGPMQHYPDHAWQWNGNDQQKYQSTVNGAFGFELPVSWFHEKSEFSVFHENLKRLCGLDYEGCSGHKHNLSVGAVFLIAMMAHASATRNLGPFAKANWSELVNSVTPWLVRQSEEMARETATCLFKFFTCICNPEQRSGLSETSKLTDVQWDGHGISFKLIFNWKVEPDHPLHAEIMRTYSPFQQWALPHYVSNATTALMRLLACMNIQTNGFGHPGHIYMKGHALHVGTQ
jgi:hypothetical protein